MSPRNTLFVSFMFLPFLLINFQLFLLSRAISSQQLSINTHTHTHQSKSPSLSRSVSLTAPVPSANKPLARVWTSIFDMIRKLTEIQCDNCHLDMMSIGCVDDSFIRMAVCYLIRFGSVSYTKYAMGKFFHSFHWYLYICRANYLTNDGFSK